MCSTVSIPVIMFKPSRVREWREILLKKERTKRDRKRERECRREENVVKTVYTLKTVLITFQSGMSGIWCHDISVTLSYHENETGNGEGISRKRGQRKRKLHSEREVHQTAGSWVGERNNGEVPHRAWVSVWVEICESPSSSAHCNPETETRRRSGSMRVHKRDETL